MQHLISKALRYGPCVIKRSHSFTCHPHTNHTAWCEKLAQSFYAVCLAESWTYDLWISSPTLYRQRHDATPLMDWQHMDWFYYMITVSDNLKMNKNFTIALVWHCLSSWTALAHARTPSRSHERSTACNTYSHSIAPAAQLSIYSTDQSCLEKGLVEFSSTVKFDTRSLLLHFHFTNFCHFFVNVHNCSPICFVCFKIPNTQLAKVSLSCVSTGQNYCGRKVLTQLTTADWKYHSKLV